MAICIESGPSPPIPASLVSCVGWPDFQSDLRLFSAILLRKIALFWPFVFDYGTAAQAESMALDIDSRNVDRLIPVKVMLYEAS